MVGAALVAILVVICRRVGDPDFWWHMETGSWIIDHGSLPSHELFTYTVSGKTWADQEWGSEVLGDLIFRAGGFLAFSLIYTAVTWVGFWFIWRRIGMERVPALIARPLAGEYGLMTMTRAQGASNARAKAELGWSPGHASWREGFRTALG